MSIEHVTIGDIPGILARPLAGHGPGVVIVQEWWGLVPHIHDLVQRFADAGFVALAADHYRGVTTTEPDEAQKMMMAVRLPQVSADLDAAAAWLGARSDVDGEQVSVVGFCMGGGLALLAPTVASNICCSVAFYPAMPWEDYAPDWTRYAGKKALINKAEGDESWAGAAITAYAQAIGNAGGIVELAEYPESVHAFFNDSRPEVYQQGNAEAAWSRTLDFLRGCC